MAESVTGLLRLKVGACRTAPTKRLRADLLAVARLCNRARNAMARAWLRWREDHPDWTPPQAEDEDGKPRTYRDGTPVLVCPAHPLRMEYDGREISFRTFLYHAGRRAAPQLSPALVSMCSGEVESRLKSAMPHNHEGEARQRWQAVLWNEANLDSFRALTVPVPNNNSALCYAGVVSGRAGAVPKDVLGRLRKHGDSGCTLAFPLWSDSAGRGWKFAVASLLAAAHSRGNRAVVRRAADGTYKLSDSELVYVEGRGWHYHLTYKQPAETMPWLDSEKVATLAVQAEGDYPFAVTAGGERSGEPRSWKVGHGPLLLRVFHRLNQRRRDKRTDYGTAGHGRRGHGRRRNERDVRRDTRHVRNLVNRVAAQAAAEVVKFCVKFGCGVLAWRQPHVARRDALWFGHNRVQWDWTTFEARLQHQCRKAGVRVVDPEEIQAPAAEPAANGHAGNGCVKTPRAKPTGGSRSKARGARR